MKIYTKTGDKGTTSLLSGKRVPKNDPRLEAYGTIDELNTFISPITHLPLEEKPKAQLIPFIALLEKTQHYLFNLGSHLACDDNKIKSSLPSLKTSLIAEFESAIDKMDEETPELKSFILPGGCLLANHIHCARSICRRAERRCTETEESEELIQFIIPFLNRLSDYLFCLSRFANLVHEQKDILWDKSNL